MPPKDPRFWAPKVSKCQSDLGDASVVSGHVWKEEEACSTSPITNCALYKHLRACTNDLKMYGKWIMNSISLSKRFTLTNFQIWQYCMFQDIVPHPLHGIISVVGHWPNKVYTTYVKGKIGESGISPNILDIGRWQVRWRTSGPSEHWSYPSAQMFLPLL